MKYIIYSIIIYFCLPITVHSQTLLSVKAVGGYSCTDSLIVENLTDTLAVITFVNHSDTISAVDGDSNKLFTVFKYDNGPDYPSDGLFRIINNSTGCVGFANMEGKIIIPPIYRFAYPFNNGFSAFNIGGSNEIIDNNNNYSRIVGGKWGFIDKEGNEVFPAIFDSVSSFEADTAKVQIGCHVFYITINK